MGNFLAVSAFRNQSADAVVRHVVAYAERRGVSCKPQTEKETDESCDAKIFAQGDDWSVILWPEYFNDDIELCRALSRETDGLISTVHVYDGDYWAHALLDHGEVVDLFASAPGYFAAPAAESEQLGKKWAGNAKAMAARLSVTEESLAPYLVHVTPENADALGKAFADDEFERSDFWVFTDFWRRIGIHYPEDVNKYQRVLRFGADFGKKLPAGESEFEL